MTSTKEPQPDRSQAAPRTAEQMETSLKRSRTLNIVLSALVVFLGVVVLAQSLTSKTSVVAEEAKAATSEASVDEAVEEAVDLETQEVGEQEVGEEGDFVRREEGDPMAIGAVDAPVVMSEWLDFQCPYCALFANDTLPTIIQQYVDDGKLRIEFHDVAYFGDGSFEGAVAARAAGEQDMYFEFMEAVYRLSETSDRVEVTRELIMETAEQIGVPDMAKFEADLESPEVREAVATSNAHAQGIGVSSVPFFVIGEGYMAGAQPLEAFDSFISNALNQN